MIIYACKRNFDVWFQSFQSDIADYSYYTDFMKVYQNVDEVRNELMVLNQLIGSRNIEEDFEQLVRMDPAVLKAIPILLACRTAQIPCHGVTHDFRVPKVMSGSDIDSYVVFMRETGLFDLLKGCVGNLVDYVTGVEVGLDSNARKNRAGHLMEDIVEQFIQKAGFTKDVDYFKEMNASLIKERFHLDLSAISNKGKTEKRFDFVLRKPQMIYGVETNFYSSSGSKLNETARSYKMLAEEAKSIQGVTFVWITDGKGWVSARHNLQETFEVMDHIYNINDLNYDIISLLTSPDRFVYPDDFITP